MSSSANDSPSPGARDFHTTHWSIIASAQSGGSGAHESLAKLCQAYWYPLYAFVRRQGKSEHDAQDLTQKFFARLLEKGWLGGVDRERGRFRSWLLASMKHFLANQWDRANRLKRGGGQTLLSLDAETAEARYAHEPGGTATVTALAFSPTERPWPAVRRTGR